MNRARPDISSLFGQHSDNFKLIAWNYRYYNESRDINRDLSWIDALINKHGPTEQDVIEAESKHNRLDLALFNIADMFPPFIRLLPKAAYATVKETRRYFKNADNIACDIREILKEQLRALLSDNQKVLLIGHSLGSVIAYDALWELSHLERLPGKVDLFLTIGSPLGMRYTQRKLMGHNYTGKKRYPTNISSWINVAAVGDIVALDRIFRHEFSEMLDLGIIDSIEDHCKGIYNFFRNEAGLNAHRSYGYLVNPAVGKIIADWWKKYDSSD